MDFKIHRIAFWLVLLIGLGQAQLTAPSIPVDSSADSLEADSLAEEHPRYVKRQYDHKQQVVVASVIMFCVAISLVAMNNYNPRR